MKKLRRLLAVCMALTMMSGCAFSCADDDDDSAGKKKSKGKDYSDDAGEDDEEEKDEEEPETTRKSRRNRADSEADTTEEETTEEATEKSTKRNKKNGKDDDEEETAGGPNGASDDDTTALLPYGFFLASGDKGQSYYFFDENTSRGTWCSQEDGSGDTFGYSYNGETAIFYLDNQTDSHEAKVTFVNDATITLDWDDGSSDTLSHMGVYTGFVFYSNESLCNLALDYYEIKTGYRPGQASAEIDANNMIVIHLYDDIGGHISTCDWYTVDRYTARGTDLLGDTVDLTTTSSQ